MYMYITLRPPLPLLHVLSLPLPLPLPLSLSPPSPPLFTRSDKIHKIYQCPSHALARPPPPPAHTHTGAAGAAQHRQRPASSQGAMGVRDSRVTPA